MVVWCGRPEPADEWIRTSSSGWDHPVLWVSTAVVIVAALFVGSVGILRPFGGGAKDGSEGGDGHTG